MQTVNYNMSFIAGALFLQESVAIAQLFLVLGDWKSVRGKVLEENLIQSRTMSSASRLCREICRRLESLREEELKILAEGTIEEQKQILWIAICRRYRFIREFTVEVVREKYLQLDLDLHPEDYDSFFNAKSEWHDELEHLTESSRNKLRQVTFRMLREADLMSKSNTINPIMLSPQVARTVGSLADLRIFPLSDQEIRELTQ